MKRKFRIKWDNYSIWSHTIYEIIGDTYYLVGIGYTSGIVKDISNENKELIKLRPIKKSWLRRIWA